MQSASRRGGRDPALVIFLLSIPCPLPCPQDACWRRELQTHTQVCPGVLGYPPPGIQDGSEQAHIFGHILPDEIWQPQEIGTGPFPPEDTDQLGYKEQRQPMPARKMTCPTKPYRQADAFQHAARRVRGISRFVGGLTGYGRTESARYVCQSSPYWKKYRGRGCRWLETATSSFGLCWARRSGVFEPRAHSHSRNGIAQKHPEHGGTVKGHQGPQIGDAEGFGQAHGQERDEEASTQAPPPRHNRSEE